MNGVMIIPTVIGFEIGGHCGDGNAPLALAGACCETLVLHTNVVNASDINERPLNALYVVGNHLDRFLQGKRYGPSLRLFRHAAPGVRQREHPGNRGAQNRSCLSHPDHPEFIHVENYGDNRHPAWTLTP